LGKYTAYCRDLFFERKTIQNKILFPFIVFSFLAIVVVVALVARILSKQIDESTSKESLTYREMVTALLLEKQRQTEQYANLFAYSKSIEPDDRTAERPQTMDISHMDLLIKEKIRIYIQPTRFLHAGNPALSALVARGLKGESHRDLIFKATDKGPRLDFDVVVPYRRGARTECALLGFSLDHELLEELKAKMHNDLFVLQNDRVIASSFHDPAWHEKIEAKVTQHLLHRTLINGESVLERVYVNRKEYTAVYAPLQVDGVSKAVFGLIMSTHDLVQSRRNVIAGYVAISLVIMVALTLINFAIINAISRPLKEMATLTDRIAQGDLSHRITVRSRDELATLVTSFNNMVDALDRKRTELELATRQLVHQEKLASLGEMAAGIAHEVGNPLSIIFGYAKWLLKRCQDDELKSSLVQISDAAQRIDRLNKNLLVYSRPGPPQRKAVDLNRTIEDALGMVEHQFKQEKNYRITRRLSPAIAAIQGNPDELQQVFVNLFNNARQAMPAGGDLNVSSEETADRHGVLVKVTDTGWGIDPENLSRVFDPFFTTKPEDKGTGLGLSITHRIVSNHDGEIRVESQFGVGTTFFLSFPYPREEEAEAGE
jgi:signal transduction histidine kinase